MILLVAVVLGLASGLVRANWGKRIYQPPELKWGWLVFAGFIPQFFTFSFSPTRPFIPDHWVPPILISTQFLLLIFALVNLKKTGFWALGSGLFSNFCVIVLNGGWMPIQPDVVQRLIPGDAEGIWSSGERLGFTKDLVLPIESTRLWFLDDRFILPEWLHYPVAFSFGDVLIAIGAFWLLWSLGSPITQKD
jgi:hypothetical protein